MDWFGVDNLEENPYIEWTNLRCFLYSYGKSMGFLWVWVFYGFSMGFPMFSYGFLLRFSLQPVH
jgi:hypothetical protein